MKPNARFPYLFTAFATASALATIATFATFSAFAETPPEFAAAMKSSKGAGVVSSGTVLPPIPATTGNRKSPVASWGKPLPYPIVVADRRKTDPSGRTIDAILTAFRS